MGRAVVLILILAHTTWAAPIIVDDAQVQNSMDPWFGVVVANFIAKDIALSGQFDEVVRARYLRVDKGDEFDVPGLRFTEAIFNLKDLMVLTLEVLEGGKKLRKLKVRAKLQQVKRSSAPKHQPRYSPGGVGELQGIAHEWSRTREFELRDKKPLVLTMTIARQVGAWVGQEQHLIAGTISVEKKDLTK